MLGLDAVRNNDIRRIIKRIVIPPALYSTKTLMLGRDAVRNNDIRRIIKRIVIPPAIATTAIVRVVTSVLCR